MTIPIPDHLAAQDAECIASASTAEGRKPRWAVLSVWFLHNPKYGGKRFVARVEGCTTIEGERNRVNELASGTLERALKLIENGPVDGPLAVVVAETAREWLDDNRVLVANSTARGAVQFDSDEAALQWLYGEPDAGHRGFATMLANDTGAGPSTVRMQLRDGRPVMIPLRALLPFIDRTAFRRARKQEAARG